MIAIWINGNNRKKKKKKKKLVKKIKNKININIYLNNVNKCKSYINIIYLILIFNI